MKIIKYLLIFILFVNCSKKSDSRDNKKWDIDISGIGGNVDIINISEDFYNLNMPVSKFREKYPFFLDTKVPDEQYEKQRRDSTEINIYQQVNQKVSNEKIKTDLSDLFRHIKYYYPEFKEPKVFLYSSFTQDYLNPITYVPSENYLFIATDCFLGANNKYYDMMKIDKYLQNTMDQNYLSSKVASEIIDKMKLIPADLSSQSFVSQMIRNGKKLVLEDAFLPTTSDQYKMGYTKEQIDWAKSNEFDIWNFFIQNNYVFSDDIALSDRFLSLAPFSKFYTEIDAKSPGNIGSWIGWQISRKYLNENTKVGLQDFIKDPNHEQIFSKSKYKPLQIENTDTKN